MQSQDAALSTFLSDEEEMDGDFAFRPPDRSKIVRRTSCMSNSGVHTKTAQPTSSSTSRRFTVDSSATSAHERIGCCKEPRRAVPGEMPDTPLQRQTFWSPRTLQFPGGLSPGGLQGGLSPGGLQKRASQPAPRRLSLCRVPRIATNGASAAANIQVAVRFRPLISREVKNGDDECRVDFEQGAGTVELSGRSFTMDRFFTPAARQSEVYDAVARPIVQDVLDGYNGTVMAYGSTGSGKTYTMEGKLGDPELLGIIPRMVSTLFDGIDQAADAMEFSLKLSAVEIYMEKIIDLLRTQDADDAAKSKVRVREDPVRGVWVDAVERHAATEEDVFAVAHTAQASRRVAATHMNVRSSRSHYILMLRLTALDKETDIERQGVLYLVDLAGSEKVSQTGAAGQTLEEAKKINRSLSCLGNVIVALTDEKLRQHVPYRDSKLTRVLQQSLGGNAKTALIATCSLATSCLEDTLTTLRFGERVKSVQNSPKVNEHRSMEQLLRDLSAQTHTIESLKRDLANLRHSRPSSPTRSVGACSSTAACEAEEQEASATTLETDPVPDIDLGLLTKMMQTDVYVDLGVGPRMQRAFMQLKHELSTMKHERDIACEQLAQLRSQALQGEKPSHSEEVECSSSMKDVPVAPEVGEAMKVLEVECAALRNQVTSLADARNARDKQEHILKEEVLLLRDEGMRSSQEVDFLRREVDELRQVMQSSCCGDIQEERRQWDEMLGNEVARRESACEQWRAYLSSRVHKVVQLETEVEYLQDALASLQLNQNHFGLDITDLPTKSCPPEVAGGDGDGNAAQQAASWFNGPDDCSQLGRHANIAQPVLRRRRQRSCERQLPKSPQARELPISRFTIPSTSPERELPSSSQAWSPSSPKMDEEACSLRAQMDLLGTVDYPACS